MKEIDILIKNGTILTMNKETEIIENGFLAIKNGKIIDIGKLSQQTNDIQAKKIINGENYLIMPGFINTHTHSAMSYFRGIADDLPLKKWLTEYIWPIEKKYVSPKFVKNASELAIAEMIYSGITSFVDMYFFEDETAKVCNQIGIRCFLGEGMMNFPTPSFNTTDDNLKFIEEMHDEYIDNDLINFNPAPHAIYTCSKENILKAKRQSDKIGSILHIHLSETEEEVQESIKKYGMRPVEYLHKIGVLDENLLIAHCNWINEKEAELLAKYKVNIAINPESNMKLATGIPPIKNFLDYNINVSLGTDGAASNNNLDMLGEMDTVAKLAKAFYKDSAFLNAKEVVKFATINGAKSVNKQDEFGSLEKGKLADVILISLDDVKNIPLYNYYSHLVYVITRESVRTVIIDGKIIMENKEFKTIDIDKVKQNAYSFAKNIKNDLSVHRVREY
ncbi:MAG: hypothetical protein DRH57_06590 [Candidatus Cloacimonadota bacterium]|nr:MAG: hypothetical protein DRH57_06590 [Candidatus Cloacimonadota bacterium]